MFCEKLKEAREKAGLSQDEIARELGISQPAYSYIENGERNPSLPVAKRIAVILNMSLDSLVGLNKDSSG